MKQEKAELIIRTFEELKCEDDKNFFSYIERNKISVENRYKYLKSNERQIRIENIDLRDEIINYLNDILGNNFDWDTEICYYIKEVTSTIQVRMARIDLIIY